ncbi:unnamed protein product, partial [Urochloa humidicola]
LSSIAAAAAELPARPTPSHRHLVPSLHEAATAPTPILLLLPPFPSHTGLDGVSWFPPLPSLRTCSESRCSSPCTAACTLAGSFSLCVCCCMLAGEEEQYMLIATEMPESETVEPEPEVGEEAFVETEENQG